MIVVGIDTGFSGALASLIWHRDLLVVQEAIDMPTVKAGKKKELDLPEIRDWLEAINPTHIFIEKAQAMPGQGVVSTGRYMQSFGELIGLCVGLSFPYTLVHPASWKRAMLRDMKKGKDASLIRVKQIYPDMHFFRKKDHGKADAILIARYGWQVILGGKTW